MRIAPKYQTRRVRGQDRGGWIALPPLRERQGKLGRLLATRGSMTAALQRHGNTTVRVLSQRLELPNRDETGLLGGLSSGLSDQRRQQLTVREVLLHVESVPWVFAHTLANAPARALLRRVGRRPLATVLFTDPRVHAGGLHYRSLAPRHPLHQHAQRHFAEPLPRRLTARRALFIRGPARLLVTEVFLPAAS